jgi:hypothetical protein
VWKVRTNEEHTALAHFARGSYPRSRGVSGLLEQLGFPFCFALALTLSLLRFLLSLSIHRELCRSSDSPLLDCEYRGGA